ncbi:hypothetical protein [Clostridium sp. JS66]|uniref:hypothetical protein n=1 Tax=Clostridium sp. JS66 TaxID=3064705 RepID=UPI00298DF7C6|nr:hypothetical protein [Clostridium sp. JS66]WPC43374.1 hypothetical protein Q6H37_07855 [Clostridium sp. JS66]
MFEIKYRIVEDIKELLLLTPEVFDDDFNDFEGQIELNFNGNKIGYVFEGKISEEMFKVGCFQDEWVILWFTHLIQAVKLLRKNNYLIFSEIECSDWIDLTKLGDSIKVRELRQIPYNIKNFKYGGTPAMSVTPLCAEIVLNTGETFTKDVEMETTDFVESFISYTEFEQEVKRKSMMLLNEIRDVFPNLINSKSIKEFKELVYDIDD